MRPEVDGDGTQADRNIDRLLSPGGPEVVAIPTSGPLFEAAWKATKAKVGLPAWLDGQARAAIAFFVSQFKGKPK